MAEDDYVEALSGEEIIIDLCSQIAERLRRDCNLRETDSYQGGYSARIRIELEAYGMDAVPVEAEVNVGAPKKEPPDEMVNTTMEIPVEPALDTVRERSDQPVPSLAPVTVGPEEARPRRYVRQPRPVGKAKGGATGTVFEN